MCAKLYTKTRRALLLAIAKLLATCADGLAQAAARIERSEKIEADAFAEVDDDMAKFTAMCQRAAGLHGPARIKAANKLLTYVRSNGNLSSYQRVLTAALPDAI